jgi:hypothetical protein
MFKNLLVCLFITLFVRCYSQTEKLPVARYSFNNGQLKNETGKGQSKVSGASFVEDRFGNKESAIYLYGNKNSYINLGTDSILKPKKGSVSLWVNVEVIMYKGNGNWDYNPILLTKSHGGDDFFEAYFIGLNYSSYKLNATTSKGAEHQITLNSKQSIALRKWHHIVMTYDDDTLALYINNQIEAKLLKKFRSSFLATDSVLLGNTANLKNERYLCGTIDDIEVYDKVLTADEVSELYNAPNPNLFQIYLGWLIKILLVITSLIVFGRLIIWWYKMKIKKDHEKNVLQVKLNELETKAIRTQMNPHFIFNSLNTLQRFILEKDFDNSHLYLTKFSRLLRQLLESSTSESITLEEEINILTNYIDIEKLRFEDNTFDFEINCHVSEPSKVYLPFMLVQPFVENAIWHGLLPKKDDRKLKITFDTLDANRIICRIDDNGVGNKIQTSPANSLKKKSLATEFVTQRLELIEKSMGIKCSIKIINKVNEQQENSGTLVEVILPKLKLI